MSQIDRLPDLDWSEHAAEEIAVSGQALLDRSDFIWKVGEVAICGLIYESFTSSPWFWFALARGVGMRDLIDFRRLALMIPSGSLTAVMDGKPVAARFAEFYGFEETDKVREHAGRTYKIFRRR